MGEEELQTVEYETEVVDLDDDEGPENELAGNPVAAAELDAIDGDLDEPLELEITTDSLQLFLAHASSSSIARATRDV